MSGWRIGLYRAIRPLLFATDPERIHHAALSILSVTAYGSLGRALCGFATGVHPAAPVEVMGLAFRNRVGLGAGFDKDGLAIEGWAALGFGFVELGTVTPRPQPGNPRPRLHRLPRDGALINRMGFNNAGADALAARIRQARPRLPDGFVIGVNIGRNLDGTADDYPVAARAVADVADYLAVNVSSPNTPGLRDLEDPARLVELLGEVRGAAPELPLVVKLSPDLTHNRRADIIRALPGAAAGVVVSNTTTLRIGMRSGSSAEVRGGLSGRPLRPAMLAATAEVRRISGERLTILASGGIDSGAAASEAIAAGADLVQLWTGMIYAGPGLIGEAVASGRGEGSGRVALGDPGGSKVVHDHGE